MHWLVNFMLGYIAGVIGATAFIFWVGRRIIEKKEETINEPQNANGYLQRQQDKLLKEQDEKPMIENERGWNCPSCGMNLIGKTASGYPCNLIDLPEDEPIHFCPMCGQAVKWE